MADTYRIRSDATWARARADYLAGETAEAVCARYDLGVTAFRERAREGGWRRRDQPEPSPDAPPAPARPFAEQMADALALADEALRRRRPAEAQRYLALAAQLDALAARGERRDRRAHGEAIADIGRECQAVEHAARAAVAAAKAHDPDKAHTVDEQVAELERRIAKREANRAPANDLRVQLRKLRARPPP